MSSNASPYQPPRSSITPTAPTQFGELKILSARGRLGRVRYIGYSMGLMLLTYLTIAAWAASPQHWAVATPSHRSAPMNRWVC